MSSHSFVEQLKSMGFPEDQAIIALNRCDNNVNMAVELLSNGTCQQDDGEFDLIAAARPEPEIQPPTVFLRRSASGDGSRDQEDPVNEFEDSRISSLKEMGFTVEQAEGALDACDGDVNAALTMLLNQD